MNDLHTPDGVEYLEEELDWSRANRVTEVVSPGTQRQHDRFITVIQKSGIAGALLTGT